MARPVPMNLEDAITEWKQYREAVDGLKPGTMLREASVMRTFVRIIEDGMSTRSGAINIHSITSDHIVKWRLARTRQRNAKGQALNPRTINNEIYTMQLFFAWAWKYLGYKGRPMQDVKLLKKVESNEFIRIPYEQFAVLLDAAPTPRDRWLTACTLFTFCRASEIQAMTMGDLRPKAGVPGIVVRRRKTGQMDHLVQIEEFQVELARWLAHYRPALAEQGIWKIEDHFRLVPTRSNAREGALTGRQEYIPTESPARPERFVKPMLKVLGLDKQKEGMHTLRRSSARAYFDYLTSRANAGEILGEAPIRILMSCLGHAQQATTEGYLGVTASRVARDEIMKGGRMGPAANSGPRPALTVVTELPSAGASG